VTILGAALPIACAILDLLGRLGGDHGGGHHRGTVAGNIAVFSN
jgi:hypothetical protein